MISRPISFDERRLAIDDHLNTIGKRDEEIA